MQMQLAESACKQPAEMTDVEFLEWVLRQGPHTNLEILRRSNALRGFGMVVNSRVSDLRERLRPKGETVSKAERVRLTSRRRQEWRYRITEREW